MLLFAFFGIIGMQVFAQKTITGTVTSTDDGSNIPGVSVLVKGTNIATVTDMDGMYTIKNVPNDATTLVFSLMGMETQEVTIGGDVVDCALNKSVVRLGDVVITALGIPKEKRAVGTAVQDLSGDDLNVAKSVNVVNSLSGKTSGVNITNSSGAVGASTRIILRGETSLVGNNQPLFVIDGVPIDNTSYNTATNGSGYDMANGSADINPEDIETISILKGANAAALYGSRAANGVIIIKTKRGQKGRGFGVDLTYSMNFSDPLRIPVFQNSYGGGDPDFYQWIDGTHGNGGTDEAWGPALDQGLEFTQFSSLGLNPEPWVSHPNNIKNIYRTGVNSTRSVALSNANDVASYRFSYTNNTDQGILQNTYLNKNSFNGSGSANLSKRLSTSFNGTYILESGHLQYGGYQAANPIQQTIWSQRQVDFEALRDWQNLSLAADGTPAAGTPLNWNTRFQNNPFWALDNAFASQEKNRFIGNFNITYKFTDWFSLQVNSATDYFTLLVTQQIPKGQNENIDGYYDETHRTRFENNSNFLASFNKTFGDIDFSLNLGGNTRYQQYKRLYGQANALELDGVYNLSNIKSGSTPVVVNYSNQSKVNSLYFSGTVSYKNFAYLDFTGRNDWSSLLPLENNSFFYPSASLSLVLTDMLGIKSDVLTFAKLRGSYAQVGSEGALSPYSLQQTFSFRSPAWGPVLLPYNPSTLNNPNLIAEQTNSWEVGLDTRLFKGRVNIDLTYYNTFSSGLIVPVSVSAASGYTSSWQNIGEMSNQGVEVLLGMDIIKSKDFVWHTNINYTKSKNMVVSLGDVDALTLGGQWSMLLQAIPGQPYGSIVGSYFERSPDGQIIYDNGLPVYTSETKILGNIQPKWRGGIENTFTYKGISLSVLVDAKIGGDIYTMTNTWGKYAGMLYETIGGRESGLVGEGVIQKVSGTDTTYVPNDVVVSSKDFNYYVYNNNLVESSVFDASYVKLRQVSFGYTFDKVFNLPIRSLNISVVGRNLAILYSNIPHIDPETAFSSDNGQQGMEFGQMPTLRTVGFNINFKF